MPAEVARLGSGTEYRRRYSRTVANDAGLISGGGQLAQQPVALREGFGRLDLLLKFVLLL